MPRQGPQLLVTHRRTDPGRGHAGTRRAVQGSDPLTLAGMKSGSALPWLCSSLLWIQTKPLRQTHLLVLAHLCNCHSPLTSCNMPVPTRGSASAAGTCQRAPRSCPISPRCPSMRPECLLLNRTSPYERNTLLPSASRAEAPSPKVCRHPAQGSFYLPWTGFLQLWDAP